VEVCCNNVKYDKSKSQSAPWTICGSEICCPNGEECCQDGAGGCCESGKSCCTNGPKCCDDPKNCCGNSGSNIECCDEPDTVCCGSDHGDPQCCHTQNCVDESNKPAPSSAAGRCCNPEEQCVDQTNPTGPKICCPVGEKCIENKCVTSCGPDDGSQKLYCKPTEEVCAKIEGITKPGTMSPSSLWVPEDDNRGTMYSCISNTSVGSWRNEEPNDSIMGWHIGTNRVDLAFPTNDIDPVGDGMAFCGYDITKGEATQENVQACGIAQTSDNCTGSCKWLEISKIIDGKAAAGEADWASHTADLSNVNYIENMSDQLEKRSPNMGSGYYASGLTTPPIGVVKYAFPEPGSTSLSFHDCYTKLNHWGITNLFYNNETGACTGIYDASKNWYTSTKVKGSVVDGNDTSLTPSSRYLPTFYTPLNPENTAKCKEDFPDPISGQEKLTCMPDGTLKLTGYCNTDVFSNCRDAIKGKCNFCYPCTNLGEECKTVMDNGYTLNPGESCPGQLITTSDSGKSICNSMMGINPSTGSGCVGSQLYIPTPDNTSGECHDLTVNQTSIYGKHIYGSGDYTNVGGLGGIPPVAGTSCQSPVIESNGFGCYDDCGNQSFETCNEPPSGRPGVCYDNDQINMYIINRTPYTFKFNSGGTEANCPDSVTIGSLTYEWSWIQGVSSNAYACQMSTGEDADTLLAAFNFFPNSNTNQPSTVCDTALTPSNEAGGGYDSTQPTWIIHPWSGGYGYARQNYSDNFGSASLMTGQIKLEDTSDPTNQLLLTYLLDESSGKDDNRVCGKDLKGTSEISKGNWKYNGSQTCVKVTNDCRNSYYGPVNMFETNDDLAGLLIWTIDVVHPNSKGTCS